MAKRSRLATVGAPVSCLAALAGSVIGGVPTAHASTSTPSWRTYVEAPKSPNVKPVSAKVLSGNVTNPRGITTAGSGTTTLTVGRNGKPATILLDYGKDVSGTPWVNVRRYGNSGSLPSLQLAFSETREYLYSAGNATLADAAAAGDSTITVAPLSGGFGGPKPLTFAVGDTIMVGDVSDTIAGVSGTTITLTTPLAHAVAAGAAVTSTPGELTGDSANNNYPRSEPVSITATRAQLTGGFEGGQRYEAITLSAPGTVELSGAGIIFQAYRATAAQYQGYFESSSNELNTIWYDGAYTEQLDMQPPGQGVPGQIVTTPLIFDGAKRDRGVWSGDIAVEGQGVLDSLGTNGSEYIKQSLLRLITATTPGSPLFSQTDNKTESPSLWGQSYSSWTLDSAVEYFKDTGDVSFAQQVLPALEGQIAYDATVTNANGLITCSGFGGDGCVDWDFYDSFGSKPLKNGVNAEFNIIYYRTLQDMAYLENALGNTAQADAYTATAATVKAAINADLWNPTTGAYDESEGARGVIGQDANSLALLYGVAPPDDDASIVAALKSLWGPHGSAAYSANADASPLISPYMTGYEVEALYAIGDSTDAQALIKLTWNQMINKHNSNYTGAFWENLEPDGTIQDNTISMAHGWSSGTTPALTSYVLGVQPTDAGYRTFSVAPQFSGLRWAKGKVPTPYGQIAVSWKKTGNHSYSLSVTAPPGTTATVTLPGGSKVWIHGGNAGTSKTFAASA